MIKMNTQKVPSIQFGEQADGVVRHAFVTGATGFIGPLLVRALLADGWQVTVLARKPKQAVRLFSGQVRCVASIAELDRATQIDTIFNLAGARILGWRWSTARQAVLRRSRIGLTDELVQWIKCAQHKPRLLISASATGYYGVQPQGDDTELTETSPAQDIFMSRLCQDWETAAQRACALGVRVIRIRFGLVLGQQGALPMMLLPFKLGVGGPMGSGRQWLSWIHVHDLLRAVGHVMVRAEEPGAANEVYNFTTAHAVMQREFAQTAAQVLRRPGFFPTPAWPMRLILGEQADLLLEGQRVYPACLIASGFQFTYPELRPALEDLN
jgi:uncharacterized protein (TIGR01777 family)